MNQINVKHEIAVVHPEEVPAVIVWLKRGIWIYFILLIFEGSLRKWFLPGLATPLLIARDPLALWLLIIARRNGLFPFNFYALGMILIGLISIFTAIFLGHGNLFVALFGVRILVLQFPLLFVIGRIFNRQDVITMGRVILFLTPFITILIALQFYSPQSAWVNRGVGGDLKGSGFSGALGYFRPSGTFSFTNGTTLFFGLAAPFIFYFWLHAKEINKIVLITSSVSLLAAIPLSISRTLFFSVLVSLLFVFIASIHKPRHFISLVLACLVLVLVLAGLSKTSFFQTASSVFFSRFETANESEGGVKGVLADRYLGGMITAFKDDSGNSPFFGYGLGMGTNVGSVLLTGNRQFLISEGEWGRLIGEMGTLFGLIVIFLRLVLSGKMVIASYRKMKQGDLLPWFLMSFGILQIPQGQWAQPTSLGFCILTAGLILSTLRNE